MRELIIDGKGNTRRVEAEPTEGIVVYQRKELPEWREQVEEGIRRNNYRESVDPNQRKSIRIPLVTDRYTAIVFTGDWHIGAEGFAWEQWRDDMQMVMDNSDAKLFLMGDLIDNFTWFPGAFEQVMNPHEQVALLLSFLDEAMGREKILGMVSGNHTAEWLLKNTGLEFADIVTRFMRLPYLREGGLFYIDTGQVIYTVLARHRTRYNSSFNMQHGNRRAFHMEARADIVVSGHTHELGVSDEWLTADGKPFHTFMVKSGCYKIYDRYAKQKGYPQRTVGSAVIIINPLNHELYGVTGVERGLKILRALNE